MSQLQQSKGDVDWVMGDRGFRRSVKMTMIGSILSPVGLFPNRRFERYSEDLRALCLSIPVTSPHITTAALSCIRPVMSVMAERTRASALKPKIPQVLCPAGFGWRVGYSGHGAESDPETCCVACGQANFLAGSFLYLMIDDSSTNKHFICILDQDENERGLIWPACFSTRKLVVMTRNGEPKANVQKKDDSAASRDKDLRSHASDEAAHRSRHVNHEMSQTYDRRLKNLSRTCVTFSPDVLLTNTQTSEPPPPPSAAGCNIITRTRCSSSRDFISARYYRLDVSGMLAVNSMAFLAPADEGPAKFYYTLNKPTCSPMKSKHYRVSELNLNAAEWITPWAYAHRRTYFMLKHPRTGTA
ncbi:hypothetical protein D9C73_017841 [Collichthys lucidus]|uniref:Uncharacterized protein n=1 Tax=Collichthys lucidus TaxID=240159 RepID=A0A4U5V7P9_COLLU|nr:hypothetical protein D9C73_017841 [Collichthys lucidus]